MESSEVQAQLLQFLRGSVFDAKMELTEETDLMAHGFDSLSLVSLLTFVEKTYGIWIPQGEITEANLKNAQTLAALVTRHLPERQP